MASNLWQPSMPLVLRGSGGGGVDLKRRPDDGGLAFLCRTFPILSPAQAKKGSALFCPF